MRERETKVLQIYCLDKMGYWNKRCLFVNADKDLGTLLKTVVPKLKNEYDTTSALKGVVYNVY